MQKKMTRRNFVKSVAVGTAATYLTPVLNAASTSAVDSKSRVVIASHNQLIDSNEQINAKVVSTDPVALDFSGMMLIDAKRQENKMSLVSKRATYLHTAATLGLGTNDPTQIALLNMELG